MLRKKTTLQGTNISPQKWHFEDDFPFPQVGYVNFLEGNYFAFGDGIFSCSNIRTYVAAGHLSGSVRIRKIPA